MMKHLKSGSVLTDSERYAAVKGPTRSGRAVEQALRQRERRLGQPPVRAVEVMEHGEAVPADADLEDHAMLVRSAVRGGSVENALRMHERSHRRVPVGTGEPV